MSTARSLHSMAKAATQPAVGTKELKAVFLLARRQQRFDILVSNTLIALVVGKILKDVTLRTP